MTINYSDFVKVRITIPDYLDVLLEEIPASLLVESFTPAANHIFEVHANKDYLGKVEAAMYYHITIKLLYLSKRALPNIQLPISFLTT